MRAYMCTQIYMHVINSLDTYTYMYKSDR